jgi:phosphatidylinositol dimannoside acyltransferase
VSTLRDRVQAVGYGAAATLVRVAPEAWVRPVFRLAADVAWRRGGRGVRQLERNLRRVVDEAMPENDLRALSRAAMRSYARYWLEFFRLPRLGAQRILGRMAVDGVENLDAAVAAGRGVILALPHTGNWDHAGAWLALRGNPFTTVAERLRPVSLYDRFVAVREKLGMEVLALEGDGSGRAAFGRLLQRLRSGGVVCLVSERDLGGAGIPVTFFGEQTAMPAGPASLAIATGGALLPTVLWFTDDGGPGGGWGARIGPPVPVPADGDRAAKILAMTQALADAFAAGIAEHPQDWHMLQPLWSADRALRAPARVGT